MVSDSLAFRLFIYLSGHLRGHSLLLPWLTCTAWLGILIGSRSDWGRTHAGRAPAAVAPWAGAPPPGSARPGRLTRPSDPGRDPAHPLSERWRCWTTPWASCWSRTGPPRSSCSPSLHDPQTCWRWIDFPSLATECDFERCQKIMYDTSALTWINNQAPLENSQSQLQKDKCLPFLFAVQSVQNMKWKWKCGKND